MDTCNMGKDLLRLGSSGEAWSFGVRMARLTIPWRSGVAQQPRMYVCSPQWDLCHLQAILFLLREERGGCSTVLLVQSEARCYTPRIRFRVVA